MAKVSSKVVLEAIQSSSLGGFVKNNTAVAVSLELLLAIMSWCLPLVWICIGLAAHLIILTKVQKCFWGFMVCTILD